MWHETRGVSCLCFVKCVETKCWRLARLHSAGPTGRGSWRYLRCHGRAPRTLHMHEPPGSARFDRQPLY